ncbi:unnamed protein product [Cuscuta campestris]|uniref:Uncharacterized protein n=1 Tax=Cuscuta campestris TaxID=132261 RepID=A0A484MVT8_9ASTE|nr:unnamed protein product [Cuscuta campestris]
MGDWCICSEMIPKVAESFVEIPHDKTYVKQAKDDDQVVFKVEDEEEEEEDGDVPKVERIVVGVDGVREEDDSDCVKGNETAPAHEGDGGGAAAAEEEEEKDKYFKDVEEFLEVMCGPKFVEYFAKYVEEGHFDKMKGYLQIKDDPSDP